MGGSGGRLLLTVRAPGSQRASDRAERAPASPRTLRPISRPPLPDPDLWVPTPSGFPPSSPAGACISMPSTSSPRACESHTTSPITSHPPKGPLSTPIRGPCPRVPRSPTPCLPRTGSSPSAPGFLFFCPVFLPLPLLPPTTVLPALPAHLSAPTQAGAGVRRASLGSTKVPGGSNGVGAQGGSMGGAPRVMGGGASGGGGGGGDSGAGPGSSAEIRGLGQQQGGPWPGPLRQSGSSLPLPSSGVSGPP